MIKVIKKHLFLVSAMVLLSVSVVSAQEFRNYPTKNVLEYSLSSLYNRAEELSEHNRWLGEEITALKEEKIDLQKQLDLMDKEIAVLRDNTYKINDAFAARIRELQLTKKNTVLLNKQMQELNAEHVRLKREWQSKTEKKARLQKEIAQAIEKLGSLKVKDVSADIRKKDTDYQLKKARLHKLRTEIFDEVSVLRAEIRQMRSKDNKPMAKYDAAKRENRGLQSHIDTLQREINALKSKRDRLSAALTSDRETSKKLAAELKEDIKELKVRKTQLKDYLAQIKQKAKKDSFRVDFDQKEKTMRDNLLVIKKENTILQQELGELKRQNR